MPSEHQQSDQAERIDSIPTAKDLGIEEREISRRKSRPTKLVVRFHSFEEIAIVGEEGSKRPFR